ncbi:keto-deoxy-phosphogluconate aldolase [Halioglobus japonicus]|uniref:2-dehydro-3-deoxy-phosphogluconate aldolase n=1 Tax=Halioglobus japonicus TaxID=930805 RepID=A0AAP8MEP1_9GAMM|nr:MULTISPECIES: bifunctional 4-hydroxy-2-oxoglutarate aldolase/2-dehydro-3-deoxy-phosphogluconate aldolase [Halioglobus]AQA18412.1 keto-deoxy-phosphogluconate aldolase [Halioglobus japonicus]KZX60340.1 keto-deoxy-phosphogluconate aldolase [Halioglobus sp. HI00S01]PLW86427.1 keto-deoxy-phosphogluconate aldolase [Halioglobus japonicus]GHD12915.1 ketohydroxyglutarate aldolase [Halioglobus japonicus]
MLEQTLAASRVLPVVTAGDISATINLARALQRGGMTAIEITLRTPTALDAIAAVQREVPELLVAAGTVNTPADVARVVDAGVTLALSPGATPALLQAAAEAPLDFVPGVASASEILQAQAYGFELFKLFPAVTLGGLGMLKALGGPFPEARFCPTGGLSPENFRDFLALPNVVCCGGSWMVASSLVAGGDWDEIERLAREAMSTDTQRSGENT